MISRRPTPTGRRALVIAVVFSLLLPGLGHAYMNRLGRALIWFGGTIIIAVVLRQGGDNTVLALSMAAAIAVCAAADIALLSRVDSPGPRGGR